MAPSWVWLCSHCVFPQDVRFVIGGVGRDSICARCGGLAHEVFDKACQLPQAAYVRLPRPPSKCTDIDILPRIIWDTNRYYASLGVDVHATKADLREAYQRLHGWDSEWLTYCVKQLLDPVIRWAYDLTPVGTFFFDEYVRRRVLKEMAQDLSHTLRTTDAVLEDAEKVDLDHLMNKPFQVAIDGRGGADDDGPPWRYYLWQSGSDRTDRLVAWQELITEALDERGEQNNIAVGFLGSHMGRAWEVVEVGHLIVAFLSDNEWPSADLALQAAGRVDHIQRARVLVT